MEEGGEAPSPRILLLMYRPGDRLAYGHRLRNQPSKADPLTPVDADAVTTELDEITTALRAAPQSALPN
jgi:hypothetical protein